MSILQYHMSSTDEARRNHGQVSTRRGLYSTNTFQLIGLDTSLLSTDDKGNSHKSVLMKAGVYD